MMSATIRKILSPATGTCAWVGYDPLEDVHFLRITCGRVSRVYRVEEVEQGYLLAWSDESGSAEYLIDVKRHPGAWYCNCPDAENRPERCGCCKHVRALKAALKNLPF